MHIAAGVTACTFISMSEIVLVLGFVIQGATSINIFHTCLETPSQFNMLIYSYDPEFLPIAASLTRFVFFLTAVAFLSAVALAKVEA